MEKWIAIAFISTMVVLGIVGAIEERGKSARGAVEVCVKACAPNPMLRSENGICVCKGAPTP